MSSKVLFLVLLGTTLVLTNPVPEENSCEISTGLESKVSNVAEIGEDNFEDYVIVLSDNKRTAVIRSINWDKLKRQLENLIEKGKAKWADLKDKWVDIKEKGLNLIENAEKTFEALQIHGEAALTDLKDIYENVKVKLDSLTKKSKEVYEDVNAIIEEVKKAIEIVKEKWEKVKKVG